MTINPLTQASTTIHTIGIELNAIRPKELAGFYQTAIGLSLLNADEANGEYHLGTPDGSHLMTIYQADSEKEQKTTGLYHLALLLPSRADLGEILRHLVTKKVPLDGASDHGYSEALYLNDPEGNGIEIYADKVEEDWMKEDDGMITGIVEAMDVEGVAGEAQKEFEHIPNGTIMGHIHLHVDDLEKTLNFYHNVLGLGLKSIMRRSAIFMASKDYHHHLGANLWQGVNIPAAQDGTQGLRTSLWAGSADDLAHVENKLTELGHDYAKEGDTLRFKDAAGTNVSIALAN